MNLTFFLIIGILLVISAFFIFPSLYERFENKVSEDIAILLSLVLVFGLVIGSIIIGCNYRKSIQYEDTYKSYNIESIGNDKYMEGHSFLFSGSVDEIDYYFFYTSTEKGLVRKKLPVSKSYIIESEVQPRVDEMYYRYDDQNRFWKVVDDSYISSYQIYVPKHTVIREFRLN